MSDRITAVPATCKRIGVAADHGGFELKEEMAKSLRGAGYEVVDFGNYQINADDEYPDFVVPLARALASGEVCRGVVHQPQRDHRCLKRGVTPERPGVAVFPRASHVVGPR